MRSVETRKMLVGTREALSIGAPEPSCHYNGPPTHSTGTREADDQ